MKIQKKILLVLLFTYSINCYLPKLYTCKEFNNNGNCVKYKQILNQDGSSTKLYKGGIFLHKNGKYYPVHKKPNKKFTKKKKSKECDRCDEQYDELYDDWPRVVIHQEL